MATTTPSNDDKYAKKPRPLNARLERRRNEKLRKAARRRRNARHG